MELLDGKKVKLEILENLKKDLENFERKLGLVVVEVGDDPASLVYVGQKEKMASELDYNFNHIKKDKRKYYGTTFETDLRTRMGNAIIDEICNARMNIGRRTEGKKKKKSKTRYRKEEILNQRRSFYY